MPCPFLTAFYGPGPIVGPGFSPPFWGWRKRRGACRGGGGAKRPHRKGGGLWPPPLRRFCGPWARKTPPPRRGRPAFLRPQATPILPMDAGWGWGRRAPWGTRRGGGVWRPGAARRAAPGRQTKERTRGPWPRVRSFRALRAPPPPPRALGFCAAAPAGRGSLKPRKAHAGQGLADCYSFAKLFSYGKRSSTLIFSGTRRKSISCDYVVQKNLSGILTKEAASLTSSWRLRCI